MVFVNIDNQYVNKIFELILNIMELKYLNNYLNINRFGYVVIKFLIMIY